MVLLISSFFNCNENFCKSSLSRLYLGPSTRVATWFGDHISQNGKQGVQHNRLVGLRTEWYNCSQTLHVLCPDSQSSSRIGNCGEIVVNDSFF